jgi:hypothetical protein
MFETFEEEREGLAEVQLDTTMAVAFREAEERDALLKEKRQQAEEAAALEAMAFHVYDPMPYPEAEPLDARMYEGTGIGYLYGVEGCEHFAAELGDWTLGREPRP